MVTLDGVPAVRMAAICFARNKRTKAQLVDFIQQHVNVSVRQISRQIRELAIGVDAAGNLSLAPNVTAFWRDVYPGRKSADANSGGHAASRSRPTADYSK